jgi:hypothetical protein
VVSNSLNNTKEYNGVQRLTNNDSNCHSNSLTLPADVIIKQTTLLSVSN